MLQIVNDGFADPQLLFITDKAYFCHSSYVSSQNMWMWSDENPHAFCQVHLHDMNVEVMCCKC
jgi:hypothetical protein